MQIVPVSATPKLAPLTATGTLRNFRRRCVRAAAARAFGSSVRPSVSPSWLRNRSRISERFLWIAGTRMCDDRSPASWMISSARSVSIASTPDLRERLVQADLVGRQRLDLDDLASPRGPSTIPAMIAVRLGGVARPVDVPAGPRDRRLRAGRGSRRGGGASAP